MSLQPSRIEYILYFLNQQFTIEIKHIQFKQKCMNRTPIYLCQNINIYSSSEMFGPLKENAKSINGPASVSVQCTEHCSMSSLNEAEIQCIVFYPSAVWVWRCTDTQQLQMIGNLQCATQSTSTKATHRLFVCSIQAAAILIILSSSQL